MSDKSYPISISEIQDVLLRNAWSPADNDDPYVTVYEKEISSNMYNSTVQIWSSNPEETGWFSIGSLTVTYSQEPSYTFEELMDMAHAMEVVEEELVKLGVPFVSQYQFHGENRDTLVHHNMRTRERIKDIVD